MADSDEESLLLAFKESGVEFVESAGKAVGDLGDKMETVNQAQAAAIEILKEEGTVVEDLKEKIRKFKAELEALNDATKAGLIPLDSYKEQSGKLVQIIRESQTTLDRLTQAEREKIQIDEEAARALDKVTAALDRETAAEHTAVQAAQTAATEQQVAFATITQAAEKATGFGEGEAGVGGFAGAAAGTLKFERALTGLATGHGLRGATTAMEGLALALGGPAGIGLAIGGIVTFIDIVLPKLQGVIDKMTGVTEATKAATQALKEHEKAVEKREKDVEKLGEKLRREDQERAKLMTEITEGKDADHLQYAITRSMGIQGEGGATRKQLDKATAEATDSLGNVDQKALKKALQQVAEANRADEANRLILDAPHSKKARDRLRELGSSHPDLFPPDFLEILADIEETAEQRGAAEEAIEANDPDQQFMERHKEQLNRGKIQNQKDKENAEAMKFAADYKVELDRAAIAAAKHAKTKADQEARHAKTKAEQAAKNAQHDAERRARESTPEAVEHRALAAQRNEEMGMAQQVQGARAQMGDTMAAQMGPAELQQVVAQVGKNRLMNSSLGFTLAQQVDYYMGQLEAKMVADFTRGMGQHDRSGQLINPSGGH
jgi:hypothetical protein